MNLTFCCVYFHAVEKMEISMTLANFITSVSGMNAQSHAMGQISANVANVNTPGYKRSETQFQDLIGRSSVTGDFLSVAPIDRRFVEKNGLYQSTDGRYDMAISGPGFFVLNDRIDGTGNEFYTRAGDFNGISESNGDGTIKSYLGTGMGAYVMGWKAGDDGSFNTLSSPEAIRIDAPLNITGTATTAASVKANIPSTTKVGESDNISIPVFNNSFESQTLNIVFNKKSSGGLWTLDLDVPDGTVSVEPNIDDPLDPLNGTTTVRFDDNGKLVFPTENLEATVNWDDGTTSTISIDLSNVSQLAGQKLMYDYAQDGYADGAIKDTFFNDRGEFSAAYTNGQTVPLYKLMQVDFTNANELVAVSDNKFTYSGDAGTKTVLGRDENAQKASRILVETVEFSNVDLNQEFSRMIVTQNAYSSASTAFKTNDEMLQQVVSLKT
jgi:flagellar hook protein FlgE